MQQENKKKILVVGHSGIGREGVAIAEALALAEENGIELVFEAPKSLKEQIEENIPTMKLEAPKTLKEPFIDMSDVEKIGIRGITNNRKLKKKRKKKAKKTHRKK